jgi:uncharacterized membrane protein
MKLNIYEYDSYCMQGMSFMVRSIQTYPALHYELLATLLWMFSLPRQKIYIFQMMALSLSSGRRKDYTLCKVFLIDLLHITGH